MERLASLPELDRLVDRDVAALELADDLLELAAEVLERPLACVAVAHGRTSVDGRGEAARRQLDLEAVAGSDRGGILQRRAAGADDGVATREGCARRERLQPGGRMVERDAPALEQQDGAARRRSRSRSSRSRSRASARLTEPSSWSRRRTSPAFSSPRSGTTRRAAAVGVDARTSAARSQSGRVLLVADGGDDRHRAAGERAHDGLVAERQEILEAAAAARHDHDVDGRVRGDAAERGRDAGACRRALHARLGDHDVRRREPRLDRGDHVAARCRVGAGDDADRAREARQRPLALRREQPLRRQHALEALDRGEMVAEPDALDRRRRGS